MFSQVDGLVRDGGRVVQAREKAGAIKESLALNGSRVLYAMKLERIRLMSTCSVRKEWLEKKAAGHPGIVN